MANSNPDISVVGLLGVLFVALKLTGFISWSWWWVTAPFWGGLVLFFALIFGGVFLAATVGSIVWALGKFFKK
jgi:hypothetical protein